MANVYTYIMLMSGAMLLFYFSGLLDNTVNSEILDIVTNPESFKENAGTGLVILAIEGLAFLALGAIFNIEILKLAPVAIYLINLGVDFLYVFRVMYSANPIFSLIIFGPFGILYSIVVYDWLRRFG